MTTQTIQTIHARCTEVGDCWEWQGGTTGTGHPCVRHDGKTVLVRRLVMQLAGRPLRPSDRAMTTCENILCVNEDHLTPRTHRQVMARQGELGKLSEPARIAKIASTHRARRGKITMDDARAIRASDETHEQAALRYGIHPNRIASIRQYKCWRELEGNPFVGLGARTSAAQSRTAP